MNVVMIIILFSLIIHHRVTSTKNTTTRPPTLSKSSAYVDIFDENDVGELREVKSEYWTQTWTPKNSLKARIFRGDKLSDKKPNWENPI